MLYSILFYRIISNQGALMDSELYSIVNCEKINAVKHLLIVYHFKKKNIKGQICFFLEFPDSKWNAYKSIFESKFVICK